MSDNIRMDSHKLIYHPKEVADWIKGKNIYPIELEVGLSGACNHRCIFCAVDYIDYKPVMIDKDVLVSNLNELAYKGLKSVIYSGEGEPLINKNAPDIINKTKSFGIDVAMSTNGVLLTEEISNECLSSLTWIRFSVAGITDKTYESIHRCPKDDLKIVLDNIQSAVKVKKDNMLKTTIGVQLLLIPENEDEILKMAKVLRELGVDYFTIKPFSQHPKSKNCIKIDYNKFLDLEKQLQSLQTDEFKIYFRANAVRKLSHKKGYNKCRALPFMVHVDANANLWPCIAFVGVDDLKYGNLYESSFVDIWEGTNRKKVVDYFNNMNIEKSCREICRLDEMNIYLHELSNPGEHVNFI